jgi:hypothetical protein
MGVTLIIYPNVLAVVHINVYVASALVDINSIAGIVPVSRSIRGLSGSVNCPVRASVGSFRAVCAPVGGDIRSVCCFFMATIYGLAL